ncbi:hypothetical protein HDU87_006091 [Geranomyces variabilis]|uniref:Bud22 domain-containing protein n=1 Tax=Geranomyces variabilis TaxID=109894 RepID=A0AAD5TIH2_9FUNG|nr:hypothetical protein HDU87_006091 [Geranomyces variabilis]
MQDADIKEEPANPVEGSDEVPSPEPDWQKLDEKLKKKMHHIVISLKRSGKKGKAFTLRAMVKKARFYRQKLDLARAAAAPPAGKADNPAEWEAQLAKLDEDLAQIKTFNPTNVLHQRFLSALRRSTLPGVDRLLPLWDGALAGAMTATEAQAEANETTSVGVRSTDPVTVLTRLENRVAATAPVVDVVKEAVEDLFVIITGRKSDGKKKIKKDPPSALATPVKAKTATSTSKRKRTEGGAGPSSTFVSSLGGGDSSDSEDEQGLRFLSGSDDEGHPIYDYGSDVFSGGESESEEEVERPAKKVRKNRAGQQARRALAERKFGKAAQHILNNKLSVAAHAEQQKKKHRQEQLIKRATHAVVPQPNQPAHLQPKTKPAAGGDTNAAPLHPSWEAKRKAKEALQNAASAAKPKKIVFKNDDDED